jgi:hypothetical protein
MSDVPRWRRVLGVLLLVVGCVLVPISLSAIWVRTTLLNTDKYVSTVGPLASNPQIQQALADDLTNAIFSRVNVKQKVADALPPKAGFLAAPIAAEVQTVTDQAALRLVESSQFQTLWENANRRAHPKVVNVLTGGGSRVSTKDGTVSINVEQILDNVKTKLDARGISIFDKVTLPADRQEFVLFQSKLLSQVQGLVDLLQTLAWVLPVLALAFLAGAIGLSPRRRRTLERAAIGVAFAVGVQLVLLRAGRSLYLDAITTKALPRGAASAVWDQITHSLRVWGIVVGVLAVLVAGVAWVVGRRSVKRPADSDADATEHPAGPVVGFVARNRPLLRGVGLAIALLVLIVWNNPTLLVVLIVGVALVVYLAAIEFLGRRNREPTAATT